eukprot:SAG11_NODE_35263_length_267_cov_0.922619_1_plen_54_part_00
MKAALKAYYSGSQNMSVREVRASILVYRPHLCIRGVNGRVDGRATDTDGRSTL